MDDFTKGVRQGELRALKFLVNMRNLRPNITVDKLLSIGHAVISDDEGASVVKVRTEPTVPVSTPKRKQRNRSKKTSVAQSSPGRRRTDKSQPTPFGKSILAVLQTPSNYSDIAKNLGRDPRALHSSLIVLERDGYISINKQGQCSVTPKGQPFVSS